MPSLSDGYLYFYTLNLVICQFAFVQDDDEADTVGCCTLKVENVTREAPNKLKVLEFLIVFTFLAKVLWRGFPLKLF